MNLEQKLLALRAVRQAGQLTRQDLAGQLQISLSLATKLTAELIARGLVYETGKLGRNTAGRPADTLALVPGAAYAVGLHLSDSQQIAVVVNLIGDVVAHLIEPVQITEDRKAILSSIQGLTKRVIQAAGIPGAAIAGVSVALSDIVDPVSRTSYGWPDTPGWSSAWTDFPVGEALDSVLEYPHIFVDDIVRTLGIAEARYGRCTQASDFVYVLVDTGIGMAIMMNGIPYTGYSHIAGEIAHMPVGQSTQVCSCGNVGCLQMQAGIPAILDHIHQSLEASPIRSTLRLGDRFPNIQDVFAAAENGDKLAIQALSENGENLGQALTVIVNLLGPRSIVLGGLLSRSDHFVESAQRTMKKHALVMAARGVTIERSSLDELSGARGAATQVLDALFDPGDHNVLRLVEGQLRLGFTREGERVIVQVNDRVPRRDRAKRVVGGEEHPVRAEAGRELLLAITRPDDQFAADDLVLVLGIGDD